MRGIQDILNERLNNAIAHKIVDRIPCAPLIECYASRFHGISTYDFLFDESKAFEAFQNLKESFPSWDIRRSIYFMHYGPIQNTIGLMKSKIPDRNCKSDNELQFIEYEAMIRQDYSIILDKGYDAYLNAAYTTMFESTPEAMIVAKAQQLLIHKKEIRHAELNNQLFLYGAHLYFPHSYFSNLRSFQQFVRDIYQIPDLMKEIGSIAIEQCIQEALEAVKETGIPRVMIGAPRVSGDFFSTATFEKLFWPDLETCALRLIEEGITPVFHLDGNWDNNLEFFTTLPKNKVIIELDGSTNIFHAKKVLGHHSCILGDVPATLFALGSSDKMAAYCRSLLSEFETDGGFILGSGCTLPYAARHENVAAFFGAIS